MRCTCFRRHATSARSRCGLATPASKAQRPTFGQIQRKTGSSRFNGAARPATRKLPSSRQAHGDVEGRRLTPKLCGAERPGYASAMLAPGALLRITGKSAYLRMSVVPQQDRPGHQAARRSLLHQGGQHPPQCIFVHLCINAHLCTTRQHDLDLPIQLGGWRRQRRYGCG